MPIGSFLGANTNNSDLTTYTFSGESLGVADSDRVIAVGIHGRSGGAGGSISSVTIGGVSATIIQATESATKCGLAYASVPSGATGAIVVTFNTGQLGCTIGKWRVVTGTPGPVSSNTATGVGAAPISFATTVPAGGFGIAVASAQAGTRAFSWTNATERYDTDQSLDFVDPTGADFESSATVTATCTFSAAQAGAYAVWEAGEPAAYDLPADGGAYALSGSAASVVVGRVVAGNGGAYTLSGSAAALKVALLISAAGGSYALAGGVAGLTRTRTLAADGGSYLLAGADAALSKGLTLSVDGGIYALTGGDAGFVRSRILAASGGSYSLTGSSAGLLLGADTALMADGGAYVLTGSGASLITGHVLGANGGAYLLTGSAAQFVIETPQIRFLRNILAPYQCEPVVPLLTIEHADLPEVIRVTSNGGDIISNGDTYQQFPFDIELPGDDDREPVAKLTIANVDRRIGDAVDAISTAATIGITLVLTSDPDTPQREWMFFELRNVTRTALQITGDIIIRQYGIEPYPNIRIRKGNFGNLYR